MFGIFASLALALVQFTGAGLGVAMLVLSEGSVGAIAEAAIIISISVLFAGGSVTFAVTGVLSQLYRQRGS